MTVTPEHTALVKAFITEYPKLIIPLDRKNQSAGNYARVEVRQYLASVLNLWCSYSDDQIEWGWKSTCLLRDNRSTDYKVPMTEWSSIAMKSESFLANSPDYAVLAMAQTRAFSKAMRNLFWWVMIELWLESTPLEEMAWLADFTLNLNWFKWS
mgnify:CR=1 FL=1